MDKLDERRNEVFDRMIRERKEIWDPIEEERGDILNQIAELQAEIMFAEATKGCDAEELSAKKHELNLLEKKYDDHIQMHEATSKQLDGELEILKNLKCRKYVNSI